MHTVFIFCMGGLWLVCFGPIFELVYEIWKSSYWYLLNSPFPYLYVANLYYEGQDNDDSSREEEPQSCERYSAGETGK